MNERIKELYDKLGLDFKNFQRVTVTESDMQYFAELIVKETILQMCIQMLEHGDDQSNNPAFYKAIEGTEKYLGIKQ